MSKFNKIEIWRAPRYQYQPYSLARAVSHAKWSIKACVVVGGDFFSDADTYKSLCHTTDRMADLKFLFPSPQSPWLENLVGSIKYPQCQYTKDIIGNAKEVLSIGESASVRWYSTPGPCWFVIIDDDILYTKPISTTSATYPRQEKRPELVEHFIELFDRLWEDSLDEYKIIKVPTQHKISIEHVYLSPAILDKLLLDPKKLKEVNPETFELLVADRLSAMGMGVSRVGKTNQKDGGIDLIAWPETNAIYPFLLAVQVKHSMIGRNVGSGAIRDLKGALSYSPIDIGMVVTNTHFTPDAKWVASQGPNLIRLRDSEDLARWLRSDFSSGNVWQDIPNEIVLGPGIKVKIPQQAG